VGNPNLDPAENREIDGGVKYHGDWFQGKFFLFYSDVKDYIAVVNAMGTGGAKPARSYKNVDATLYGGECTLQVALPRHFLLKGGLAYTRGRDDTMDEPLAEIPPLQGNAALRYDRENWFAELEGVFADEQDRVNSVLQEEVTSGWGVAHFTAGMSYKKLTVGGGIQNIFDKQYVHHLSYQRDPFRSGIKVPEAGRSFFVTLSLRI
jgi:iron complex outermembrane receptor protein